MSLRKEIIGDCTLYLGDCRDVLPTIAADHIITDPPYEDELHSAVGKINRIRTDGFQVPESLGFDGINQHRAEYAKLIVGASRGWSLVFTLAEGVRAWRDDLQTAGAKWDTVLCWVKPDAAPRFNGQGAARGFENCMSVWCGRGYRKWNGGGKRGVYTHLVNGNSRDGEHPTEKPVGLMLELVRDFTQHGDIICDPFLGSGTTLVAAVKAGRRGIGIERDPNHFETACRRIEEATRQPDLFIAPPAQKPVQLSLMEAAE